MGRLDLAPSYPHNILTEHLGEILSPEKALAALLFRPPLPGSMDGVPKHLRLHMLMDVRDYYFPPLIGRQLLQTTDLMIRQSYKYRDPHNPATWATLSGESQRRGRLLPQAVAASAEGHSGVGKTQGCLRSLNCFQQIITHEAFPGLKGHLDQVVWLSVEVPPSGRSPDLARALMQGWRTATGSARFDSWLAKERLRDGMRALDEWRQVAASHFLGILHLDEIQNLFKLAPLRQRKDRKIIADVPELSIVEDQLLRWLLYLINSGQFAMLVSGTPDGIGALTKRFSTLQRFNTFGYHPFEPISYEAREILPNKFLGQLSNYQYVQHRLEMDANLARLIVDLTGGIQRLIVALWIAAHRIAFERKTDDLRLEDFAKAAATWLAPLGPAVAALQSGDSVKMARHEDLVRRDTAFWATFWCNVGAA